MTSREISELVESRHDAVKKSIERLIEKGVIQSPPLANFKNINNVEGQEYLINKRDSYIIVAQLSPEFTAKLVDRWQELESKQTFKIPQTLPEALRLAADLAEKNAALTQQIAIDAPKVEFAMAVRNLDGSCEIGQFSALIGIGRNTFFKQLRADKILMISNRPYQEYKDRGLLVEIESTPYTDHQGKSHPTFKTMVTGKGQVFLEKKYRK